MPNDNTDTRGWGGLPRVMREHVLLTWNAQDEGDEQYFGCLSPADYQCEDSKRGLSLEVHAREGEEQAVLVKFHLSIWTPAARTKQYRDIYVILPTSGLSMTRDLVSAVPENVRKHLPPAPSYNRIHFEVSESKAPYAIMPELARRPEQLGRRVTGPARTRIIFLKLLCKAKSWDAFLVGNSTIQRQLDNVCQLFHKGRASEPKIDLGSIYNNGIRGLINSWADYPYSWHDVSSGPPPYNEKDQNREKACAAFSGSSGPELYWRTSPSPPTRLHRGVTVQATTTTKRKKAEAGSSSDDGAIVHKHPRQASSDSNSEPDRRDRIAAFDLQLACAQELSPTETDPDSSPPGDVEVSSGRHPVHDDEDKISPPVPPPDAPQNPSSSPQPFPSSAPKEPVKEGVAQPRPPTTLYNHTDGNELHYKMVHFLLYALRRDGDAIANFAKDFLEMGHHVNAEDGKAFRAVKHRCYRALATRSACRGFPVPSTPGQISDQVNALLDWLDDAISEEAYALVDRHYACVAGIAAKVDEGGVEFVQEELEIRVTDFYAAAFCVADGIKRDCPRRPPLLCAESVSRLFQAYSSFR